MQLQQDSKPLPACHKSLALRIDDKHTISTWNVRASTSSQNIPAPVATNGSMEAFVSLDAPVQIVVESDARVMMPVKLLR